MNAQTHLGEQVYSTLEDQPFRTGDWPIWCHPETYNDLQHDTDDVDVFLTPQERFGRQFSRDPHLEQGEFYLFPDDVYDYIPEKKKQKRPPGVHLRKLFQVTSLDESFSTIIKGKLLYSVDKTEYRFDIDSLSKAESIPVLKDLIDEHLPDDHPPVAPDSVDWETMTDTLDVSVEGDQWVWTIDHCTDAVTNVEFTYSVSHRDVINDHMLETTAEEALDNFVELAYDLVGDTESREITGRHEEVVMPDAEPSGDLLSDEPPGDEFHKTKDVNSRVGTEVRHLDAIYMKEANDGL